MTAARVRLAIAVVAFLGWLSYLGYLVAERLPESLVLSRPQILVSDVDVVAAVKSGSDLVTVKEVLHAANAEDAAALKGKEIRVTNLANCHPSDDPRPDLTADGDYLLPLQDPGPDARDYRVTSTPPSPGFPQGTPRIYPATHAVLAQYHRLPDK